METKFKFQKFVPTPRYTVSATLDKRLYRILEKHAAESRLSLSEYCKVILERAAKRGW